MTFPPLLMPGDADGDPPVVFPNIRKEIVMNARHVRAAIQYESLSAAAERTGVSTRTLRRWISCGRLRAYRLGPRLVRVTPTDVDDLLCVIPTAAASAPQGQRRAAESRGMRSR